MAEFASINRCIDLGEEHVAAAVQARDETRALLEHLARVSAPNTGAAKVLILFARMATNACDWLDGDLRIEIVGDAEVSVVEVMCELGAGMRERVFPPVAIRAPLVEFLRAVERVPHLISPLAIAMKTGRRLVFCASEQVRLSTLPPQGIRIAEDSVLIPRAPASPSRDVDEAEVTLPVVKPTLPVVRGERSSATRVPPPKLSRPAAPSKGRTLRAPDPRRESSTPPKPLTGPPDAAAVDAGWDDLDDALPGSGPKDRT